MIDEISLKILKILQEKARIPNVEVARQVGMAPSAVLERIRKLEQQGYIDGYEVRLNPERFGRPLVAFVQVTVDGHDPDGELGKALTGLPEAQEVHFIAGEDGYLVKLRVPDPAVLGDIVRRQIAGLPGVRGTRTALALNTMKETWRLPLD
jgi:Lrp/AsnC family leucine-responsive transcriptional regulator